jgi:hypothetical protein
VLSSLTVSGPLNARNTINVLNGLSASGTATLNNAMVVNGTTTLNGTLNVSGYSMFTNGLNCSGGADFRGPYIGCWNALTVSGVTTLNNQVNIYASGYIAGGLQVGNSMTVGGTMGVAGAISSSGIFTTNRNIVLNSNGGSDSLWIGNTTVDTSGINVRIFCTGSNPYLQFFGGTLNLRYGNTTIGTLTSAGDLSIIGNLTVPGNLTCSGNLYANTLQGNSNGGFSVAGTGSDTNLVSITIPNYATLQKTIIDITVNYQSTNSGNAMYVLINSGVGVNYATWETEVANGFQALNSGTASSFVQVAKNIHSNCDVHVRITVHGKLSDVAVVQVSTDYLQQNSPSSYTPVRSFGNAYVSSAITSVTLRASTTSGQTVAGRVTVTQAGSL